MGFVKRWLTGLVNRSRPSPEYWIERLDQVGGYGVVQTLVKMGQPAVEPLIAALRDPRPLVSMHAAEALGQIQDVRAVEPLIAALSDPRDGVRMFAARALGQLGDARAVEPLVVALRDPHRNVSTEAIQALGHTGDARAIEPLMHLAWDGYDETDRADAIDARAILALGKIGDEQMLPKLERVRQQLNESYTAAASQEYNLNPMAAEGLYEYFCVPLQAIDQAIAEIRARGTSRA
jgi:HEAT repeat protein